jgi:septal ring factor EnvC (AmiA/AmiB activator)
VEKTLNLILAEQKRQGELLYQLINTVAATNVKVAEMNEKIVEMDGRINKIDQKITEMDGKFSTNEKKLDSVLEEVKEIKARMATKHDLEYYDQMISEHSREIYKLKNH